MRKSAVCALAVAALSVVACGSSSQDEFTTKDAANIRQENQTFVEAFNAKQLPGVMKVYADNIVFMPPNAPTIRGKGGLENYYEDLVKQGATDLRMDLTEVSGHGPIAYAAGSYSLEYKPEHGAVTHDRGKYLLVLRQMVGRWRYEYSMWSSDLAKPAPAGEAN